MSSLRGTRIERRDGGGPGEEERAGGLGPVLDDERDTGPPAEPGWLSAATAALQLCEPAVRERRGPARGWCRGSSAPGRRGHPDPIIDLVRTGGRRVYRLPGCARVPSQPLACRSYLSSVIVPWSRRSWSFSSWSTRSSCVSGSFGFAGMPTVWSGSIPSWLTAPAHLGDADAAAREAAGIRSRQRPFLDEDPVRDDEARREPDCEQERDERAAGAVEGAPSAPNSSAPDRRSDRGADQADQNRQPEGHRIGPEDTARRAAAPITKPVIIAVRAVNQDAHRLERARSGPLSATTRRPRRACRAALRGRSSPSCGRTAAACR